MENSTVSALDYIAIHFNFVIVKENADLLTSFEEKLRYLITVQCQYREYIILNGLKIKKIFWKLCEIEIDALRKLYELTPLNSTLMLNSNDSSFNQAKKIITDLIFEVDLLHSKYLFLTDKDYYLFVSIFGSFYSGLPLPSDFRINCHYMSKTKLCGMLREMHKMFFSIPINKCPQFTSILKHINVFEKYSEKEIISQLTKHKPIM